MFDLTPKNSKTDLISVIIHGQMEDLFSVLLNGFVDGLINILNRVICTFVNHSIWDN